MIAIDGLIGCGLKSKESTGEGKVGLLTGSLSPPESGCGMERLSRGNTAKETYEGSRTEVELIRHHGFENRDAKRGRWRYLTLL